MKSILPFTAEHEAFREKYVDFLEREAVPYLAEWEENRICPHEFYEKAGKEGFLLLWADKKYGGQELDFLHSVITWQENSRRGVTASNWLHSDLTSPYIGTFASQELKDELMPKLVKGELLLCIAMTEPDIGSDLANLQTSIVRDGDEYIINGDKCFITNGMVSDFVLVAGKTKDEESGKLKMSLVLVPTNAPGFTREKMRKIGSHTNDASELHFRDVRIPVRNLIGEEGKGMRMLMSKLQEERLIATQLAAGNAERVLQFAIDRAHSRGVQGKTLFDFQYTQFLLAEMATKVEASRLFADAVCLMHIKGEDVMKEVSMAKWYCTETNAEVATKATQLWGGHAVCYEDNPVGNAFVSGRIQCISAGTTEIMKTIIARFL